MADGEGPESLVGLPEGIEGWDIVGGKYTLFFFLCCFVSLYISGSAFFSGVGVVYCYVCVLYFSFCVVLVYFLSDCLRPPTIVSRLKQDFFIQDRKFRSDSRL